MGNEKEFLRLWFRLSSQQVEHLRISTQIDQAIFAPIFGFWGFILFIQRQSIGKLMKFLQTENHIRTYFDLGSQLQERKGSFLEREKKLKTFRKLLAFIKAQSCLRFALKNNYFMSKQENEYNERYEHYKLRLKQDLDLGRLLRVMKEHEEKLTSISLQESSFSDASVMKRSKTFTTARNSQKHQSTRRQ